ncbi:MAG: hypothetical protein IPJ77_15485 [Planctomycetes bacterium]|nr:hypothetical protein [Planctomycetota bacterium]
MAARPPSRLRLGLGRLALVLGATIAALVAAELGYRGWLALRGRAWSAEAADERIQALATTMNEALPRLDGGTGEEAYDGRVVHPYVGIDTRRSLRAAEEEAQRFLTGEYDDAFVLVVAGGSVAAELAGFAQEDLRRALARDPRLEGRAPVVLTAARGSLKEPQHATMLAYLFRIGWQPDAVVLVDGFNELALAYDNIEHDVHPVHPAYSGWAVVAARRSDLGRELVLVAEIDHEARGARELADRALAGGWTRSALFGRFVESELRGAQRRWADASERYRTLVLGEQQRNPAKGPFFPDRDAAALERVIACWREGSISVAGMCRERAIPFLHVLQPTLHDAGSKPLTEEERASATMPETWMRSVREHYPRLRAEGRALAEHGVAFADLSFVFRDFTETTYFDGCHFKGAGMTLFAERIVAELLHVLPADLPRRRGPRDRDASASGR